MYAKVINNEIVQYPYSIQDLKNDNPDVLFSNSCPDEILVQFNCYRVLETAKPQYDITKNVIEGNPTFDGQFCYKTWIEVDASQEEIVSRQAKIVEDLKQRRANAYREESDPIFFKWQRGEATEQEWLDKVAEIRARYSMIL